MADIFTHEFDVYLTELKVQDTEKEKGKDAGKFLVAASKLIPFATLKDLAARDGSTLRTLPLTRLRSRYSAGYFCLKKPSLTEIASSTSLAEYAQRQIEAVKTGERDKDSSLSVFWSSYMSNNAKVPNDAKDPSFGDATPPSVTRPTAETITWTSAIQTAREQILDMKDAKNKGESLYKLNLEQWSQIVAGNDLLYGFQVNTEDVELLSSGDMSNSVAGVTAASTADPLNLIQRCARPVFTLAAHEPSEDKTKLGQTGQFWGQPMAEAKTEFNHSQNSLDSWSAKSGMSKQTLDTGISFPIGKATLGAKFGFERERKHYEKNKFATQQSYFIAVHSIPKAQISLNETTIRLSSDVEAHIRKLRRERKFSDLLRFFEKYGTVVFQDVTLGGRLFHIRQFDKTTEEEEKEETKKLKVSAQASLGIPGVLDAFAGGSYEKGKEVAIGTKTERSTENLSWTSIGGNTSLSVDPPRWRESLGDYDTWRAIQYDTPVRIDHLIGRIEGFSDVPVLFAMILANGVLDRSVVSIPPIVTWQDKTSKLRLGAAIEAATGLITDPPSQRQPQTSKEIPVAPAGFSWNLFSNDRNLKREIRANLQASLNPMINVQYVAPFLNALRADESTFTVMLRWTSATWKETEDEAITKKMQEYATDKLDPTFSDPMFSEEEQKKKTAAAAKTSRDQQAEAEDKDKSEVDKAANAKRRQAEWDAADTKVAQDAILKARKDKHTATHRTERETQLAKENEGKTAEVQETNNTARQKEWDAADLEAAKQDVQMAEEDKNATGKFFISSLTSRSWVIGLWTITKTSEASADEFAELRAAFEKEFSGPKSIEEGCDYIVTKAFTPTLTPAPKGSPAKPREYYPIEARFEMHASDGNARKEIELPGGGCKTTAKSAFEYIEARMRLSSVHFLRVAGEISQYDGSIPTASLLNETALLQHQEAQDSITFLQVKGEETKTVAEKLAAADGSIVDKTKDFDATVLDDLRVMETKIAEQEVARSIA